jgi:hypothetical protein
MARTACAPRTDQRTCWDVFMRRLTSVFANLSVVDVPIGRPACWHQR